MQEDPEQAMEREADELAKHIDDLGENIDEAKDLAADRAREAGREEGEDVAGDWHELPPDDVVGDDPAGAGAETT